MTEMAMNFEQVRLSTFREWKKVPSPGRLAASGFYYRGPDDTVECFECRVKIGKWEESDTADGEHARWSPRCNFLKGENCGNVPIGANPLNVPEKPKDVTSFFERKIVCDHEAIKLGLCEIEKLITRLQAVGFGFKLLSDEMLAGE